jgi:hypothetical protein
MPPKLNHNFPAEANAAEFELKLAQKRRLEYRVFHPWVVMLLEHPDRLRQFFLCWALQWMRVQSDGARSWYELDVPGFSRPFLLTPKRDRLWSIFQAARFFVLEGKDQAPRSAWMLDYKEIEEALRGEEQRMGSEEWLAFLREQISPLEEEGEVDEGMVSHWLRYQISELASQEKQGTELPAGEPADYEQAYTDLADVATLMFEERIERKELQLSRQRRSEEQEAPPPFPESELE